MDRTAVRRALLRAVALLLLIALAGATYQGVATALERREFPRPGQLVDAGGHQLHIHCLGEGRPLVVLEAPVAGLSAAWGWVQPAVARVTRVCAYDRAGLGWSESGGVSGDPVRASEELHAVLARAKETGPLVVAGDGFGAWLATVFASRFPADTSALVLIDDSRPAGDRESVLSMRFADLAPWLARVGFLRATRTLSRKADGLPAASRGALGAFLNRPDHLTRSARELSQWNAVRALAATAPLSPSLHVVRVDTGADGAVSFLTDEAVAAEAVSAILEAVAHVRRLPSTAQNAPAGATVSSSPEHPPEVR